MKRLLVRSQLAFSKGQKFDESNSTVYRGVDETRMELPEYFYDATKSLQGFPGGAAASSFSRSLFPCS